MRPTSKAGADGMEVVPAEAEVARRIFREYVAGVPQRKLAQQLNADGIKPLDQGDRD